MDRVGSRTASTRTIALRIQHVGIQGLGLIGSSVARSLHPHLRISGFDPDPLVREKAIAADVAVVESPEQLSDCDIVLLAAPTQVNAGLLKAEIAAGSERIVADLGSVKAPIERVWLENNPDFPFVGSHPMSGSELSGFNAGSADLFANASWPVVVHERTNPEALMATLWIIGLLRGRPVPMSAARHDAEVAQVSHLAQMLAGALGRESHDRPDDELTVRLAGGAYRDVSRMSAAPPNRTAEFLIANSSNAAQAARSAAQELLEVAEALEAGDKAEVVSWLSPAHQLRGKYTNRWEPAQKLDVVGTAAELTKMLLDRRDTAVWISNLQQDVDGSWRLTLDVAKTTS